mgnify:CR=1 FL=1
MSASHSDLAVQVHLGDMLDTRDVQADTMRAWRQIGRSVVKVGLHTRGFTWASGFGPARGESDASARLSLLSLKAISPAFLSQAKHSVAQKVPSMPSGMLFFSGSGPADGEIDSEAGGDEEEDPDGHVAAVF